MNGLANIIGRMLPGLAFAPESAGDATGTTRQGPYPPGENGPAWRAVAMYAPGSCVRRWRRHADAAWLSDAQVAEWPRVELGPRVTRTDVPSGVSGTPMGALQYGFPDGWLLLGDPHVEPNRDLHVWTADDLETPWRSAQGLTTWKRDHEVLAWAQVLQRYGSPARPVFSFRE